MCPFPLVRCKFLKQINKKCVLMLCGMLLRPSGKFLANIVSPGLRRALRSAVFLVPCVGWVRSSGPDLIPCSTRWCQVFLRTCHVISCAHPIHRVESKKLPKSLHVHCPCLGPTRVFNSGTTRVQTPRFHGRCHQLLVGGWLARQCRSTSIEARCTTRNKPYRQLSTNKHVPTRTCTPSRCSLCAVMLA